MQPKTILVIGAGIGGMCTAIHLAKRGYRVTVVEKNTHAGGRCDHFVRDGHVFDCGPTLLVMRQLFEEEFAELGVSMAEQLDLQRVDPTYHLVFDDGSRLALTSDMKSMQAQLEAIQPGGFEGLLRYMLEGQRHYQVGIEKLVKRDFRKASDFFTLANLPLLYQVKPLVKHYRNVGAYFDDPRLRAAFTFQDMYMGLSPFDAPATFSLMPYTELAHGVWYPRGGMYGLAEAIYRLACQAGVEFRFRTPVAEIEIAGGRVNGVRLEDGQHVSADAVVANADLPYVYAQLLPPEKMRATLAHKRFSCSVISFFWGLDKPYPALAPHTLFLSHDYREAFDSIISGLGLPSNPCVYLHAPTRLDPAMAPAGQDSLTAIVPVGHLSANGEQDWAALCDQARAAVFSHLGALGLADIPEHIKFETSFTPLSWRKRYNLVKGATHGLCHNLMQLGYLRPANRHARYHNLYFTGASTHPGTGLPTAMVSGRLTAARVAEDLE